ncbi:MAG TPA: hypothetical protein VGQ76_03465 [Thermoanaerobaculia bacterium]|jgi:hypothetical protein|nr:hypothetical protein [Thermoanaerobaculia bacterium]
MAIIHAGLFLWMLSLKPFVHYPGPEPAHGFSLNSWHLATSIMVAGRDLHHDDFGMALFVADLPVMLVLFLISVLFGSIVPPLVGSYLVAAGWLVGGSWWWFLLASAAQSFLPTRTKPAR